MIWRHLFGYLPANLVMGLTSFGTVYVFTRLLGADDYGRYALVLAGMQLAHTLFLTWSEAGGYRFTQESLQKGELADHIRTSLGLCLLSCVPALLVVAIGWLAVSDPAMRHAIAWLSLTLPTMTLLQMSLEIRKARQEVQRFSMMTIARALGGLALGVVAAYWFDAGASAPFIGLGIASLVIATLEVIDLWKISRGGKFRSDRVRAFLTYGAPISFALALELGLSAGDRFLIAAYLDEASVGAYAAGYGVADQTIRLLCMWAAMAGAPHLLAAWEKGGQNALQEPGLQMSRMLVLITLPAAVGIALVATPLAEFMVGEDLRAQAAHIMPWIAVAGLLNGWMIYYFGEAFVLAKRTGLRAVMMLAPVLANIVLNMILLPRIGLMGAVYATVACYALALVLSALIGQRLARLPVPLVDVATAGLACVVMAGATLLVPTIGGLPELIAKAIVGAIAFGAAAIGLNAAGARDLVRTARSARSGDSQQS
ncbi:MAG: polysaccharide biosynthesis protein [Hirschia sp.]|nr:polysaccharide biosynthesis protein [Hirschia sp.]MBF18785.1 polysaccharide biosynthesis protein [Hirschia sp.]